MSDKLRIGDLVLWSGSWGRDVSEPACIEAMELCQEGQKYGEEIEEIDWNSVKSRTLIVSLDNGHWAYGTQIERLYELRK
jgi:hypothetical protein